MMNAIEKIKDLIICVDMDGTLTRKVCWNIKECLAARPNKDLIQIVNKLYDSKFIVVYTARRDKLIPASLEWLRKHNVRYHAFSNIKIPGHYIDDKATNPHRRYV